jgi:Sec-independent protein translocase protein TatA
MIFKRWLPVLYAGIGCRPRGGSEAALCTLGRRNPVLSPADMLIIGAVALIAFGPDQLPKVARKAGQVFRDVQNTSQGFIREMEHAADDLDVASTSSATPSSMYGSLSEPTPAYEPYASYESESISPSIHEPAGNAAHPFAPYASRPGAVVSRDAPTNEAAGSTLAESEASRPHLPESVRVTE